MTLPDYGLGRYGRVEDSRDNNFPMQAVLAAEDDLPMDRYLWAGGWWGNQESKPHCVEYSWHHWLCDGPVTQKKGPLWTPGEPYEQMQDVDEWPGSDYDGTSVRAGAKVLQRMGFISSYYWGFDVETVIRALRTPKEKGGGPVVVGTNWYSSMFYPNAAGLIKVDGRVVGGHAYKLDGVSMSRELVRIKNSWGRGWSRRGFALISFSDLDRLIREDGEACIATEVKLAA